MQPHPSFDRGLLIPIAVGVISLLGIAWIFLTSDLSESLIPPTAVPTTIPSNVSPFETTTLLPPSAPPTLEETPPTATGTSPDAYPEQPAETLPSTSIVITETRPAPSATPTPEQVQPFPAGKYDDMDPNIAYDRYWTVLKNPGTANAYKGTLHFSSSIGNEASFRFTGQQFYIGYQRGRNFGIVTVMIDDQPYSFHEQAFDLIWRSPQLSPGTHSVRIIHESGESINLDYIEILD
jgi:hypothetical protein